MTNNGSRNIVSSMAKNSIPYDFKQVLELLNLHVNGYLLHSLYCTNPIRMKTNHKPYLWFSLKWFLGFVKPSLPVNFP